MVPSQLTFRRHAFDRLAERLSLTAEEVIEIIDNDLCVLIGEEDNRYHKVFYSQPDKQCFVAIHDHQTNELVTILPLDYHHRWQISEAVYFEAKAKICPYELTRPVQLEPVSEIPAVVAQSVVKSKSLVIPDVCGANNVRVKFTCYFKCPVNHNIYTVVFKTRVVASELSVWLQQLDIYEFVKGYVGTEMWDSCQLNAVYYAVGKKERLHQYPLP